MNSTNVTTLFPQLVISRSRQPWSAIGSRDPFTAPRPATSPSCERHDLATLLRLVTWIFQPLATRKNVTLQVNAPVAGLFAVCDEIRIQHVLEILLTNAVNMAPNNSTIVLTAHQSGNQLRFSIEDEGAGVSSDEQDSFFDSTDTPLIHFISDDCGEENDLALCRRIVTAHGGMISMRNRAKVGTRFEFSIPTVMPLNADSVSNVA